MMSLQESFWSLVRFVVLVQLIPDTVICTYVERGPPLLYHVAGDESNRETLGLVGRPLAPAPSSQEASPVPEQ